jgi:hypothetical protein
MEESPILSTQVESDAMDEFNEALSDLAYANPVIKHTPPKKKHSSRFFFTQDVSVSETIKTRAKKFKPKKMIHVDNEVESRLKLYKTQAPKQVSANMEKVREFFLTVVGPRSLAGNGGATQAKEVVQRMLNTEIGGEIFDKFDRMSQVAANMVMAKFIAKYYNLPATYAQKLVESIQPKQANIIPIPNPLADPNYEPRHLRNKKAAEDNKKKDTSE